jgi:hypothetical protein
MNPRSGATAATTGATDWWWNRGIHVMKYVSVRERCEVQSNTTRTTVPPGRLARSLRWRGKLGDAGESDQDLRRHSEDGGPRVNSTTSKAYRFGTTSCRLAVPRVPKMATVASDLSAVFAHYCYGNYYYVIPGSLGGGLASMSVLKRSSG